MVTDDPSTSEYWENLYRTGENGWDKGAVAPPIARMLREGFLPPGARIAVIGAGPGHEVFEAARLGFAVTAVDFAPTSVQQLEAGAKVTGTRFQTLQRDLFTLPQTHPASFDAVLEHTCFCAIDPKRRREYVEAVHAILAPRGVLFGLFYAHGKDGGPPWTTNEAEVRTLFEPRFSLERLVRAPDSFEPRRGNELEVLGRCL